MALADARKLLTGRNGLMVSPNFASWNQMDDWLRVLNSLLHTAQQLCAVVRRNPAAAASRDPATR